MGAKVTTQRWFVTINSPPSMAFQVRSMIDAEKVRAPQSLNRTDDKLRTGLMHAVAARRNDIIKWLIDGGADVNMRSIHGESALSLAIETKNEIAIRVLMMAGADYNIQDQHGRSMFTLAKEKDRETLAAINDALKERRNKELTVRMFQNDQIIIVGKPEMNFFGVNSWYIKSSTR